MERREFLAKSGGVLAGMGLVAVAGCKAILPVTSGPRPKAHPVPKVKGPIEKIIKTAGPQKLFPPAPRPPRNRARPLYGDGTYCKLDLWGASSHAYSTGCYQQSDGTWIDEYTLEFDWSYDCEGKINKGDQPCCYGILMVLSKRVGGACTCLSGEWWPQTSLCNNEHATAVYASANLVDRDQYSLSGICFSSCSQTMPGDPCSPFGGAFGSDLLDATFEFGAAC